VLIVAKIKRKEKKQEPKNKNQKTRTKKQEPRLKRQGLRTSSIEKIEYD